MARRSSTVIAAACVGAAIAVGALLLRFPPEQYEFYPQCPVYRYLHWLCPGCGSTRALAAMLRGHLMEAFHYNAFFVALFPFLVGFAAVCCYRAMRYETFRWPEPPRSAMGMVLVAAVIFTVARNLL